MEWFEGGIIQAISTARNEDKLMVVYVFGENTQSEQVTSALESTLLSSINPRVISVRLKQPSLELTQFSQIYPVLVVPSLYFICSSSGVALQVLAGPQEPEVIIDKTEEVLTLRASKMIEPTAESGQTIDAIENLREATVSNAGNADEKTSGEPSSDDKVQRAERIIQLRRIDKAEIEMQENRRKEVERREALKNMERIKNKEMKDLAQQNQKEREEEKRYRAQVQEKIKQDRLEMQQRQQDLDGNKRKQRQEQQEEAERRKAQNSVSANIMFRLPDGTTVTNLFEADDVFLQVRQFIAAMKNLSNFNLALNFPRRIFDTDCDGQSLRELQLAPSAVLLVIPKTQSGGENISGVARSSSRGLWDLLAIPFTVVLSFFASLVAAVFPSAQITATESNPNRDAPGPSRKRNQSSGVRQRTPYQRNGNITRLNTSDESDNETNTWNGNSTQQM